MTDSIIEDPAAATSPRALALRVEGMHCGGCAGKVRRALEAVEGVASAEVDHAAGRAEVTLADAAVEPGTLLAALREAGYPAGLEAPGEAPAAEPADRTTVLRVEGMRCGNCAAKVRRTLEAVEGVASAEVDHAAGRAEVALADPPAARERLVAALQAAGYPAAPWSEPSAAPCRPAAVDEAPADTTGRAASSSLDLAIEGMTCASCVASVEKALLGVPGVASASVNLANRRARVGLERAVAPALLERAVAEAGYKAESLSGRPRSAAAESAAEQRRLRRDLATVGIAALLTLPLVGQMVLSLLGIDASLPPLLQLALAAPVQFWAGARFYRAAWPALKRGRGNMDLLVALGTSAAFGLSLVLTLTAGAAMLSWHGPHLYYEAAAAVVTLVLLGRVLEERARHRTSAAVRALLALKPEIAHVERNGAWTDLPATELKLGDRIAVRPGERVPADAEVRDGESQADEALLTGESLPVDKAPGDALVTGSINGSGLLIAEVTATGEATRLARIVRLVEGAQASKPPVQKLVDRISAVFVPVVVAIALVTLAGWLVAGAALSTAILHAVAVLVIACPCALGLATPAAIMVGMGVAARNGVLIKDSAALEAARRLDTVVFDKTGTLTLGRPSLVETVAAAEGGAEALLRLVASAQQGSEHPLAGAILAAASEAGLGLSAPSGFKALAGRGIEAEVEGRRLAAGNRRLMAERAVPTAALEEAAGRLERRGLTVVWVALDGVPAGLLALGDELRPGAAEAVTALQTRGLEVVLLTGDNRRAADAVATAAGIPRVVAEVLPEDKAAEIARLQGEGRRVAMVGDGVNDAPALARAELGIAMGEGSDVALETAPVALMRAEPLLVAEAVDLAKAIHRKIAENLFWAFVYNAVAIPFAAFGLLSPVVAGAAMALSSVSVVGNALLLNRHRSRVRRAR
ncbi:Cu+-exporting ATPase [Tistlia consotensis]|uniref:Cu+-exporting ATPase n=1 Tax=Tistlia consotensis USBA 355 TaxID=560819 RepID=A0A1Y6CJF6_9PROT|nr:copper-translocating P-type ATPase [Tistlia consotensis]SMF69877.1 Cu+-exporting ATPase [Tistlia consotensis USBA 355]SNS05198.1 Cu+-exporting ATPase [Tistlia consotensis]